MLGFEAVTAILDGKRILGDSHDIPEFENSKQAYDLITELDPYPLERVSKKALGTVILNETAQAPKDSREAVCPGRRFSEIIHRLRMTMRRFLDTPSRISSSCTAR